MLCQELMVVATIEAGITPKLLELGSLFGPRLVTPFAWSYPFIGEAPHDFILVVRLVACT